MVKIYYIYQSLHKMVYPLQVFPCVFSNAFPCREIDPDIGSHNQSQGGHEERKGVEHRHLLPVRVFDKNGTK